MLNCVKFLRIFEGWIFVIYYQILVKLFLIWFYKILIFFSWFFKYVDNSTCIIVAFKCPAERILCCLEQSHSSCSLLWHMIINILTIHIFFSKITSLVFKYLTIQRQYLRKKADISLFLKLISRISINKNSFSSSMSMKIQKPKILVLTMIMSNDLLYRVNRRMMFVRRIDITTIQIDPICVNSIMSPCHSIRIYYRKDIKHKFIPQESYLFTILS